MGGSHSAPAEEESPPPPPPPPPQSPGADEMVLYEDFNRQGRSWRVGYGRYWYVEDHGIPNDAISSIEVGENARAYLYNNAGFGINEQDSAGPNGQPFYTGGVHDSLDWNVRGTGNDRLSSFILCKHRHSGVYWDKGKYDQKDRERTTSRQRRDEHQNEYDKQNGIYNTAEANITKHTNEITTANGNIADLEPKLTAYTAERIKYDNLYNVEIAKQNEIVALLQDMREKYRQGIIKALDDRAITVVELDVDKFTFLSEDDKYYIEM